MCFIVVEYIVMSLVISNSVPASNALQKLLWAKASRLVGWLRVCSLACLKSSAASSYIIGDALASAIIIFCQAWQRKISGFSSLRVCSDSTFAIFWNVSTASSYFSELAAWSPSLSRIFASSTAILPRQYSRLVSEALTSLSARSFSSVFWIFSTATWIVLLASPKSSVAFLKVSIDLWLFSFLLRSSACSRIDHARKFEDK